MEYVKINELLYDRKSTTKNMNGNRSAIKKNEQKNSYRKKKIAVKDFM